MIKKLIILSLLAFTLPVFTLAQTTSCLDILPNPDVTQPAFAEFDRYINVLEVLKFYAEPGVSDAQLLHSASIGAELLDNDENGIIDDIILGEQLMLVNAVMPLFLEEGSSAEDAVMDNWDESFCVSAVLYSAEIAPWAPVDWFEDACLEEILHTINSCGHVEIYPSAFALLPPGFSQICQAMDVARGGQFLGVPGSYPDDAWYHYDDVTCDYECMAIEYLYWSIVTDMGVLDTPDICDAIAEEWEPCSPELFESMDPMMHSIVNNPDYKLPQLAPDGIYCPKVDVPTFIMQSPSLYPNPSQGSLTIELNYLAAKVSRISISDSSGREAFSQDINTNESIIILDLPKSKGLYFLCLTSERGESIYNSTLIVE